MHLCYALDLVDEPAAIAAYEHWHRPENIWPEIPASIRAAGIRDMEIFRVGNRLCLLMDVDAAYSAAAKARADAANPRVQAWEAFVGRFQRPLPWAAPGEKWVAMPRIFSLRACLADTGTDAKSGYDSQDGQ